jgi:hypothetical protein
MVLYTIFFEVLKKYRVLPQNPKRLAFSSTGKCLFTVKMVQKSVFYTLEAHILARLDITMLDTIFSDFTKYRVSD